MAPKAKIRLVRQDGSSLDASPEHAAKLKLLGYREESVDAEGERLEEDAKDEYYSSGPQQFAAGLEGAARGITAGLSDYALGSEDTKERAKYNPGIATATEITGGVVGAMVPITPVGLLGKAAGAAVKGSGLVRGAARGLAEGVVLGGAMEANHAYLKGDPITAEAVLHGMGWGALFGAGLGGAGGALAARGEANIARGLAAEAEAGGVLAGAAKQLDNVEAGFAAREAGFVKEAADITKAEIAARAGGPQFMAAPGSYKAATEATYTGFRSEATNLATEISKASKTVDALLSGNKKDLAKLGLANTMDDAAAARARIEVSSAWRRLSKAMDSKALKKKGGADAFAKARETFEAVVAKSGAKAGLTAIPNGKAALTEFVEAKLVMRELKNLPLTAEGFASMRGEKAEAVFAAFQKAKKLSNFPALGKAVEEQANRLQEAMGLTPTGVAGLKKTWEQAARQIKAEKTAVKLDQYRGMRADLRSRQADFSVEKANAQAAKAAAKGAEEASKPGLLRRGIANAAGGFVGGKAAAMTGSWRLGGAAFTHTRDLMLGKLGRSVTPELVAARNQTLGRIKQAVGKYQVKAGKGISLSAPRTSSLAYKLDGTPDNSTKDVSQLAYNRLNEFAEAGVHIKDTMYRAVEPLMIEQPELGPALHQAGVSAFTALRSMMPADPGVVSGLKPIWRPSALQAAVMSRQISVFQDPVGVAEEMLFTGVFDPISVKAMKEIAPATYQQMRTELIERVQEPGFLESMQYRDQVALGSLMDIPIHSSMKPEYIAASQAMHMTRNQPLPTPAIPGSSNGGRPAADTPGATAAQITTSR